MYDMVIQKVNIGESVPWELLLLADPSVEKVTDYLRNGDLYVAMIDDQIIAEYVIVPLSETKAEIMNIAVDPKWQGKGIGNKLLLDAIERSKMSGYVSIEIGTGNSSINQIKLYKKCGFEITGIDEGFFLRNYPDPIYENGIKCEDMIRMTITLR